MESKMSRLQQEVSTLKMAVQTKTDENNELRASIREMTIINQKLKMASSASSDAHSSSRETKKTSHSKRSQSVDFGAHKRLEPNGHAAAFMMKKRPSEHRHIHFQPSMVVDNVSEFGLALEDEF